MFTRLVQLVVAAAGVITGWFLARDAAGFGVLQGAVSLLLVTLVVALAAFGPSLVGRLRRRRRPDDRTKS